MKLTKKIFGAALLSMAALAPTQQANAGGLPDLVVRDFELHSTGNCSAVRSVIRGTVTIKNVGSKRARALLLTPMVTVYDAHDRRIRDRDVKINSLAPGESTRVRVKMGRFFRKGHLGGWRKIIIKVDPRDKIRESNELNNSYAVRIPVNCRYR